MSWVTPYTERHIIHSGVVYLRTKLLSCWKEETWVLLSGYLTRTNPETRPPIKQMSMPNEERAASVALERYATKYLRGWPIFKKKKKNPQNHPTISYTGGAFPCWKGHHAKKVACHYACRQWTIDSSLISFHLFATLHHSMLHTK